MTNSTAKTVETTEDFNTFMVALILQSAILLVFFGNGLVLAALTCYRNWTSADVLLFSLSLADILDSIVALELITVVKYFLGRQMTKSMCDAFVALVYTFRFASATTVTFIAVERSLLLIYPFKHHTLVTPSRIRKFVAGIWFFSVISAILPFIGVGHSGFKNGVCFSQLYDLGTEYAVFIEVYGAIMLLAVITSYIAIKVSGKMFIRRQTLMTGQGEMKNRSRSVQNRRQESVRTPGNTSGVRSVRKLALMMGIVVIIYYISWLPFLLNNLYCLIVDQQPSAKLVLFTSLISLLHALANPPLYGWMSQRYRRGYFFVFKMVLSMCGGHRPNRRSLSVSRRYNTGANLPRQQSATDITVYNSRLSLPLTDLAPATIEEDRKQVINPDSKEIMDVPDEINNNEAKCLRDKEEGTPVEAEESEDAENADLVSGDVIQLLDAMLEKIDEAD